MVFFKCGLELRIAGLAFRIEGRLSDCWGFGVKE